MKRGWIWGVLFVAVSTAGCGLSEPQRDSAIATGHWRAWLESPGGELPFGLEIRSDGDALGAWLVNGPERIPVPRVEADGRTLTLGIPYYDSRIRAELDHRGTRLDGEWTKTAGRGRLSRLPFHATAGTAPRFPSEGSEAGPDIAGRWRVDFENDDLPAIGIFETAGDGQVVGTFLTSAGDYRYLAGRVDGNRLRLSCFDGAHAFLFDARLRDDGSLAGDFWSRDSWHETWTARRDDGIELSDPFQLTRWTGELRLDEVDYPDLDGRVRSLADPAFAGRARLIVVFGSWCPNCNDAAEYLAELDRHYRTRGLSVLGLAFEMTGDFERDAEQVRRYVTHHRIEFPILVAGTSDKEAASTAFRAVDRVRAYPTTIFIDGSDRVHGVYTGYSGPATGRAHEKLRLQFETLIESMLARDRG